MQVRQLLVQASQRLKERGIEQSRLEAELLLAHLLGQERLWLVGAGEQQLSPKTIASFEQMLARRQERMPLAYLTGCRFFRDHCFEVTPEVLIPRPETEELVEHGLQAAPPSGGFAVDLGAGSGCIGVSLLTERTDLQICFSDISTAALEVSRRNATRLAPCQEDRCLFWQSDLFSNFPARFFQKRQVDLIIANLPYVFPGEWEHLAPEITLYEPPQALVCSDPLALYAAAIEQSAKILKEGASLVMELSPGLARGCLEKGLQRFWEGRLIEDLSQRLRFLHCRAPII